MIERCTNLREFEHYMRDNFGMTKQQYESFKFMYKKLTWEHHQKKREASALTDTPPNTTYQPFAREGKRDYGSN